MQLQGEAAVKRADNDKDVRVQKLTENDDIVAYLTTFERLMKAYEVKEEKWAFKLATNLVGKAQQAYAALSPEEAGIYEKVKEAILLRYDITEDSYRQKFRSLKRNPRESGRELVARLDDLAAKWLKSCKTPEEVRDRIILEQFLNTLPEEVRIFVKERKPKSAGEAGKLADDFSQARKSEEKIEEKKKSEKTSKSCHNCGKFGHIAKDCRMKIPKNGEQGHTTNKSVKKDLREIECFNCHKKGHYSTNCPRNAMFCVERKVNQCGTMPMERKKTCTRPGMLRKGLVEGKEVQDILLDTGCTRTLVHQDLVPEEKVREGNAIAIRCAHGDTVLYPLAEISLEVEGHPITVEAAVSNTLPMSVLLGTDNPELKELLNCKEAFAVMTRAESRRQREEEEKKAKLTEECGVCPKPLINEKRKEEEMSGLEKLDDEIFGESREKKRQTKQEKRQEKRRRSELEVIENATEHEMMENATEHEVMENATDGECNRA